MFTFEDLKEAMSDRPMLVRVLVGLWALVTAIHVTIWLLIAVIGGHLDKPWWLLVSGPLAIVIAGVWWLTAPRRPRDELL